ncbi:hypothetical protein XBP1_3080007 [Xenorhabdus bovienii str. puntauvense]|uniref:Uncharacterized protein n=1 Tax=Xenorhabdus bovienii str. puntauvense TaxID=1398201 RepID=A0A077NJ33_XENBV|nr:hypothetical protein XBFFR1_1260008 [Xenorhabdus bovienii str. feltiae France]CDG93903.1 hypothetical protein XBFFL1_2770008 [Xenorhabdus bovienii str. feltiae Florida]CDG98468.1 hypothetical protein XBP1_3080007 [Xenorhabdus bovienii str. puntauvense]
MLLAMIIFFTDYFLSSRYENEINITNIIIILIIISLSGLFPFWQVRDFSIPLGIAKQAALWI